MYNLTHLLYKSCSRKSSYSKIASKLATICICCCCYFYRSCCYCCCCFVACFCFAVFCAAFDLCVDFVHIYLGAAYGKVMKYAHEHRTNCLWAKWKLEKGKEKVEGSNKVELQSYMYCFSHATGPCSCPKSLAAATANCRKAVFYDCPQSFTFAFPFTYPLTFLFTFTFANSFSFAFS